MKTAISIPDSLFRAADEAAEKLSISRSELYSSAIQEYLNARFAAGVKEKLDEVYAEQSSGLEEPLAEMQFRSLPEDIW